MSHTDIPRRIVVNDTVVWLDESHPEYPADDGWVLHFTATNQNATFDSSDAAVGAAHQITIDTTDLEPGDYRYTAKVAKGAEQYTVDQGFISVDPDFSQDTAGVDRREYAEKALEAIEAVLIGKASKDQTSYSLNGRALSRYSPDELNAWRASLRVEIRDLKQSCRRKTGGKSHNNVHVRFPSGSI